MKDLQTQTNIKFVNRSGIFQYIYNNKGVTKQDISYNLRLSLPTVNTNLSDFINENLILSSGYSQSTGGRKAKIYSVNPTYRYAIGIDIWNDYIYLAVSDLYGSCVSFATYELSYNNSAAYFQNLAEIIFSHLAEKQIDKKLILGVGISIQGLVSDEDQKVVYGDAMNTLGISSDSFSQFLPWSVHLIRNVDAAATMEIWNNPSLQDCVYLMLNRHFGGTIIVNSKVYRGSYIHGGTIEHMCLIPNGNQCYCGKKGCSETYCSIESLERNACEDISDFFAYLRADSPKELTIWHDYLHMLALTIDNIRMLWGNKTILGGYLAQFINQEDISLLEQYIYELSAFKNSNGSVLLSNMNCYVSAQGASLYYIKKFIQEI